MNFAELAAQLAEVARYCHARGWAPGTSGNFSATMSREPLRLVITPSGVDKGELTAGQMLGIDERGQVVSGSGRPSAEAALHLLLAQAREADAVLHTHSVWSTILSEAAPEDGLAIEGYEMLKGLAGVDTHLHREWLPIVENTQAWTESSFAVEQVLSRYPATHGFLIRGHGLYTWGQDVPEARRHVETLEFLLEVMGRKRGATWQK